jgi:hypothetical protein
MPDIAFNSASASTCFQAAAALVLKGHVFGDKPFHRLLYRPRLTFHGDLSKLGQPGI